MKLAYGVFCAALCVGTAMAGDDISVNMSGAAERALTEGAGGRLAVLTIEPRPYSEAHANTVRDILRDMGIETAQSSDEGELVRFSSSDEHQELLYDKRGSVYRFVDRKAEASDEPVTVDSTALRAMADAVATRLAEGTGSTYRYVNAEYEYRRHMEGEDSSPKLMGMGFRYVKVVNGRLVLGTTNQLRIVFGGQGRLRLLSCADPITRETGLLKQQVRLPAVRTMADRWAARHGQVVKRGGRSAQIVTAVALDGAPSYIAVEGSGGVQLVPHFTLLLSGADQDGETVQREAHFCLDAERVANLNAADVIRFEGSPR